MYSLGDEPAHSAQQRPDWNAALDREQEAADEGSLGDFAPRLCKGRPYREEHLPKKERTVASRFLHLHCPPSAPGSDVDPVKENHTPKYRTASVGGTVVMLGAI